VPDDPIQSLLPTLRDLSRWFRETNTPYLVIGGIAVSLTYRARTTRDVDAVVLIDEGATDEFVASGAPFGFLPRIADAIQFAAKNRVLLMTHQPNGTNVDISLGALAFEKLAIEQATTVNAGGIELRVPCVEDLIIMKALASRPIDLADIDGLLNMYPDANRERIRQVVSAFVEAVDRPDIIERLDPLLKASRPPRQKPGEQS
jgi:predicted nucleotidyltransferase